MGHGFFEPLQRLRRIEAIAVLTLLTTSVLFFYDLFGERVLLTERDLAAYFIPPRFFWVESLKHGDFPLWNPYQFTGHPFLANPQHGLLYPLNGILLILPFDIAFNLVIILHFFLAGLFTYLLLRDLKAGPAGSLLSGLTVMLSGYLLSVHSLLNTLLSVTWTPLILLFFRRAIVDFKVKNALLASVAITLSFLGGGIEVVYGNFLALFLILLIHPPSPSSPRVKTIKGFSSLYFARLQMFLILSLAFLLFSGIQLFPFLELWVHSVRGQGITFQEATTWSLAPKDLLLFFLPDAYGYFLDSEKYWITQCWLKTMYTGGLPFILSGFFFLFGTQRKLFLSLMLFSLFLALGQYNPLYPLVYQYVPFFKGIRYPVKFLYLFILCLAMTAGLGFNRMMRWSKEGDGGRLKHLLIFFSLLSGLGLLGLVGFHGEVESFLKAKGLDFPHFNHVAINLYHTKRFLFYLALFFLLLRVGYEVGWKGWVKGLLLLSLTTDLFGNMGFYGKEKTTDYFKPTKVSEIIASDPNPFRVFTTARTTQMEVPVIFADENPLEILKEKNFPSISLLHRFWDVWGLDVVRLKRNDDLYRAFTGLPSISSSQLPILYGIKYVVSVTPIEDPNFELVYARLEGLEGTREELLKLNTIKLYRFKHPVQRAWFVREFNVLKPQDILVALTRDDFQPLGEVLLEESPPLNWNPPVEEPGRAGRVRVLAETNNRLSLEAETEGDCLLVLNDTYYPGWKVLVNGVEKKIFRANYGFRAVPLEKGTHRIDFVYTPMSFKLGVATTTMGMMGAMAMGIYFRKTSRREKGMKE